MKIVKYLIGVIIIVSLGSCNNQGGVSQKSLENEIDSVSYSLGLDMAIRAKANFSDIDNDLFIQGYRNGIDSLNLLINKKDISSITRPFFQKRQAEKRQERLAKAAKEAEVKYADVKKEGIAFLEKNKSKKGVNITESGLQYIVLKEGNGEKPTANSRVKVHYHGTLIDGTVFESTVEKNTPAEFGINEVIRGCPEGLKLMKTGSKYKFFIPQELAYGATPRPGKIKPFMPLIFELELLEIKK